MAVLEKVESYPSNFDWLVLWGSEFLVASLQWSESQHHFRASQNYRNPI